VKSTVVWQQRLRIGDGSNNCRIGMRFNRTDDIRSRTLHTYLEARTQNFKGQ
jgi:hypothetical protein